MLKEIKVLFVSSIGAIVHDNIDSQKLYIETLGLPLKKKKIITVIQKN